MKLELVHDKDLSPNVFEKHPVWAEYYESDDIDRMMSDGFEREDIISELKKVEHPDRYLVPVVNYLEPSPYEFTLYKATVVIGSKHSFDAYLFSIGNKMNAIAAYDGNHWQVINFAILDQYEEIEIKTALGVDALFPLEVTACGGIKYKKLYKSRLEGS